MFPFPPGAARRALVIFALWFVLVAAVYRHTPINFLRAESGWYLAQSHSSEEIQRRFKRDFFTGSYGGHYVPLALLAEFETAKIAGTNESIWKWRQILALALISAVLCGVVSAIGGMFQLPRLSRWAMSAAFTAGAVFRPEIMEFISWPIMILQLAWIGFFLVAMYSAVKVAAATEQKRWPWIAAAAACASMQAFGLGLVTVASVAAVFCGILFLAMRSPSTIYGPHRKRIATALGAMLCVAAVHGWAMLRSLPAQASFTVPFPTLCRLVFGFAANLATAAAETFVAPLISEPNWRSLASTWPYGLLLIASVFPVVFFLLRQALREPTPQNLTRFALHAFSISAFFTLVALCTVRVFQATSLEAAALSLTLSTSVPRYIVPLHFIVIASVIEIAVRLCQRAPRLSPAAFCAIALVALTAQIDFRATTFVYVEPLSRISHASALGLLLATVRECRAAQLPVPNLPLGALTREFSEANVNSFEPLLRHDLQLRPEEKIDLILWEQYLAGDRERYRSVPSLRLLEQKLGLQRN